MTTEVEIWLRPWARFAAHRRISLAGGPQAIPSGHAAPVYLYNRNEDAPRVDGRGETVEQIMTMSKRVIASTTRQDRATTLSLLPFPVRRTPGFAIDLGTDIAQLTWPDAPERPHGRDESDSAESLAATALMQRTEAVWDRIEDVDEALADPENLWQTLRRRWTEQDAEEPHMDVIVRHARNLARTLDALEARPRRILRRVHRHVPLGRVQEIDRRAMLWLARQPGETLAERAGDEQRILAVAREENFDTLENRVLRAYAELANRHARDYLERNHSRRHSRRAQQVDAYARRCSRLEAQLRSLGVRKAEPGVTPNFALQQNPLYRQVWTAWDELLKRNRIRDELWRWQARSWQEYCTLAIIVALIGVKGARVVATAPLWFRGEHNNGCWIEADTPLAVVHLPDSGLVIEVQTGAAQADLASLGATLWLRIGRIDDVLGIPARFAIWPIWSPGAGLVESEAREVQQVLDEARNLRVARALVIRPASDHENARQTRSGSVLAITLGTEGDAQRDALAQITEFIESYAREAGS